jgi:hypothetical protein
MSGPIAIVLALAAAAQDAPASADAEILHIYDAVCARGEGAPTGFRPVEWSAFPPALRLLNTYGHEGIFLLRDGGGRTVYVARTSGPGRDSIAAAEGRCGVAIRGANFDRVARTLARQLGVRPLEMNMLGHKVVILQSPQGALSVNEAEQGWIIVRAYNVSFR